MAVTVKKMIVGPVEENCYLVYSEEGSSCIVIDPGFAGARIVNVLKALGRTPKAILLTHGHYDHIMAVEWLRKEYPKVSVYAYETEKEVIEDPKKNMTDQFPGKYALGEVLYRKEGSLSAETGLPIRLMATPGHTTGSCCYYLEKEGVLFSGDTLFLESTGRTDFPTGDDLKIRRSIRECLMPLPEETCIYPGHGENTSIGHEKKYNFIMLGF